MLSAVLLSSLFVLKVAALPGSGAGLFKSISPRQVTPSQIPAQCRDQGCDDFISALSTCQNIPDASYLCSNNNEQAWAQCLECLQPTNPTGQATIDQFLSECQQDGIVLPPTTLLTGTPVAAPTGLNPGSTPTGVIPESSATGIITVGGSRSAQQSGIMQTTGLVGSVVGQPSSVAGLAPANSITANSIITVATQISQITQGSASNTAGATISLPQSNDSNTVGPLTSMSQIAIIFTAFLFHAVLA